MRDENVPQFLLQFEFACLSFCFHVASLRFEHFSSPFQVHLEDEQPGTSTSLLLFRGYHSFSSIFRVLGRRTDSEMIWPLEATDFAETGAVVA